MAIADGIAVVAIKVIVDRIAGDGCADCVALSGVFDHATAARVAAIGLRRGMKAGAIPAILRQIEKIGRSIGAPLRRGVTESPVQLIVSAAAMRARG